MLLNEIFNLFILDKVFNILMSNSIVESPHKFKCNSYRFGI